MERTVESAFRYDMKQLEENRIRIIVMSDQEEVGTLYFERAKREFNRKPISLGSWACVDAKIGELYDKVDYDITPKDVVNHCQELILWSGL